MPITAGSALVVVHPFTAEGEGELTVAANTPLAVLETENEANAGWILVRAADGRSGYVPLDFVKEVAGEQPVAESSFKERAAARMSIALSPAARAVQQQQNTSGRFDYLGDAGSFRSSGSGLAGNGSDPWATRNSLYGSARTPIPVTRRWYYRDLFGDMQGPFNTEEMRQRVDARHIQGETNCILEVGSGAAQMHAEKPLREFFPSLDQAFRVYPIMGGSRMFWYFLDDANQEHGPFSSDQMRLWFDVEGYFGPQTPIREAQPGATYEPLRQIYPDPMTCFLGGTTPPAPGNPLPVAGALDPNALAGFDAFQPTGTIKKSTSSRMLLQAALAGGEPPVPPAAIGKPGAAPPRAIGGERRSDDADEDEDDVLALFDKVGLSTEEESPKKASGSKTAKLRIYGTPSMWPVWKGVPNFNSRADNFPTTLYHFFTRPLNPNAGKILCHIIREVDGISHFNHNKFTLFLENETGPQPVAIAFRHTTPMSSSFEIKLLTSGRLDSSKGALTIAKMDVNFMGTQFLLHNGVPGHQGKAKDLSCVLYEANRMGKGGPRRMKVGIPDIEEEKCEFKTFYHGASGAESLLTSLQHINARNLIPMLNKPPRWNEAKKAYSLDFGGRVTRASVKNFQLVDAIHDPEHANVILQHGRVGTDKFTMDVQHPMSLLQAFAVCLSSLHQKKAVD